VGHSTFLIQLGGINILTDPVWGPRVPPIPIIAPSRRVRPPFPLSQLPAIDIVVISHNHYDHLESATVRHLARSHPGAAWFVPLGLGAFVARRGAATVHELDWFQSIEVDDTVVACVPAQHSSARTPLGFDRRRTLWCGWAFERDGRRIYFAGDTAYFPGFAEIGARLGPFNVALLPIGSYMPRSFMQYVHMNPPEAVQAFQDLYSRIQPPAAPAMIPMHWGTYKLTIESLDEPPKLLRAAWSSAGLAAEDLHILEHGERLTLTVNDSRSRPG
jgi:N-acyl-phosphatidylethanolamine-hydrolysing phospholipase D